MIAPTLNASQKTKKTHFGEIPVDWGVSRLDQVAEVQTGLAKGKKGIKNPVTLPYLRVANVQDGYFDLRQVKTIKVEQSEVERYSLRKNDVLLTEGGDLDKLGRGHLWEGQVEPCLHQNHVFVVRTRPDVLLPLFFAIQTGAPYGRRYFLSCAKQTTNLASINSTQLKHFPVLIPPLREQHKIAAIVSTWDRAIEQAEKLVSTKQQLKLGLMQRLLTGKQRFKDFAGEEWKTYSLSDLLERVFRPITRSGDGPLDLVSIRRRSGGLFFRGSFTSREFKTLDLNRVEGGDFLISKRQVSHGALAMVRQPFSGMHVSNEYVIFQSKAPEKLSMPFFDWLSRSPRMWHKAYLASNGVHFEKLIFDADHFLKEKIAIPPSVAEQQRIVALLEASDAEIRLLKEQLTALRVQKRGLLQKLLTGKVRLGTR
jgi:type I restriction enzyme S subunit